MNFLIQNNKVSKMNTHYNYRGMSHPLTWLLSDPYLISTWRQMKRNADRRGIRFELSFQQYLLIWLESGHLEERGTAPDQYCLSRYQDKGSYRVGNVEVKTNRENSIENGTLNAKRRKRRIPAPHGCIVEGTYYPSYRAAAKVYDMNHFTVRQRVLSDSDQFKEWRAA